MRAEQLLKKERTRRRLKWLWLAVPAFLLIYGSVWAYTQWDKWGEVAPVAPFTVPSRIDNSQIDKLIERIDLLDTKYTVLYERFEFLTEASADGMRMEGGSLNYDSLLSRVKEDMAEHLSQSAPVQQIAQAKPEQSTPDPPQQFVRNKAIPLPDDLNNPGALIDGEHTRRHGCNQKHVTTAHDYAVCPTRAHGIAALIDMILSHKGRKIRHYIGGGDGRSDPWWNYSGGDKDLKAFYFQVFTDRGIDLDAVINGKQDQLTDLINGHTHAEGGKIQNTAEVLEEAFRLVVK